jgi:hypothetical protein
MSAATVHATALTAEVMTCEPINSQRCRVYDNNKQRRKIFLDLVITFYMLSVCHHSGVTILGFLTQKQKMITY